MRVYETLRNTQFEFNQMVNDISNKVKADKDANKEEIFYNISSAVALYGTTINSRNYFGQLACILPIVAVTTDGYIKPRLIGSEIIEHVKKFGYDKYQMRNKLSDEDIITIKNWQTIKLLACLVVCIYPILFNQDVGAISLKK